jgi:hypothetical protein
MANYAQNNWIIMKKIYANDDPYAPIKGREHTSLFLCPLIRIN